MTVALEGGGTLPSEFRQRCEAIATDLRYALGKQAFNPLLADDLATHLSARILTPADVPHLPAEHVSELLASTAWSAAILVREPLVIMFNPAHSPARRESNLMHEFAHVLLKHPPAQIDPATHLPARVRYLEREAEYLGACLQLPRRALWWAQQTGLDVTATARIFRASEEMVRYRARIHHVQLLSTST